MTPQKIAIVTGGGSGIGLAIAQKFVANQIFTIIIGRDKEKLEKAQASLGELCAAISFDLNDLSQIPALVESIAQQYGKIDILVNNAGINMKKELTEVSDEDFQRILHTNVSSVFAMSREVVKQMLKQKSGVIIHISSMAAMYGLPKVIAYTASKSAIEGMTKAMASELSPLGIRVNAIAPGFIATDMSAKALNNDPERKQKVLSRTPMGYLGETADIGEAALFLASDGAKYITGVSLRVDGGNAIGF
ncbi:SDR family NAD(P)-dependent oxidoreductase [Thermoflexibacter ruber]|uniref:NAD(P)-dependent dehydrogenase, short-chain alcohol dehydrogenase family n=1 Tax=Thermoflexibacter ruber TaxID=1003 RepID=A0A1I2J4P9_9BACT|nr:glucose 1-dehydrogenase [Thermoflexibacter ruber]SFF47711.1 NAD(P)-dependent dehydrogenase, short-chain alcohol dehydrogenase family [Thermoflexibacter ruber]